MSRLEEILAIYKESLKSFEDLNVEAVDVSVPDVPKDVPTKEIELVDEPQEGDVIEIFPSPDGLEMVFLVFRIYANGYVELLPVSRFIEFATPEDVLVYMGGEPFIVQTDLGFEVPLENFSKRFGNRRVLRIARLTPDQMTEVDDVYEGRKKGAGGMYGGPKEEFKEIESRRYFNLFATMIAEEESYMDLSAFFERHKEYALVAGEEEKTWGRKKDIRWFYDRESERLILIPSRRLVGMEKRIILEAEGERMILFEGKLPKKIELSLSSKSYNCSLLERTLKVEDV